MKRTILLIAAAGAVACSDGGSGPGATATRLSFTAQPGSAIADTAIPGEIKISVLDQNGGVLTSATSAVTVAIGENPGSAALDGNTTVNAVAGVATFTGLTLNSVGAGYTLVATSPGLVPDTSSTFTVTLSLNDGDGDTYSPNAGDCNDFSAAVNPDAVDFPDATFIDMNCDGLDGERDNATFVSQSTGLDDSGCGTEAMPCATIQQGIDRAVALGRRDVYVVAGDYAAGAFTMANGVSVYGGFGLSYSRSPANVATVIGNRDFPIDGATQSIVVLAENLTAPTTLADLTLSGADANARLASGQGKSAYVIVARNVPAGMLTIARNTIIARNGMHGQLGANGTNASSLAATPSMDGTDGGNATELVAACDASSRGAAGSGGSDVSGGIGLSTRGGNGGPGGEMDTDCTGIFPGNWNTNAQPGDAGAAAAQNGGVSYGGGGAGGGLCANTAQPGIDGRTQNGAAGFGGAAGGHLIGDFWYAHDGADGAVGANGGGGGGGGGSGGCDASTRSYGAGGGGGGSGGVRASGATSSGKGGGGSFGIYLINAFPTISNNTITLGNGGNGGAGGVGGQGQSGGLGGDGGPGAGGSFAAGRGGDGGHGGHGGGGGGGSGGSAFAIYLVNGSVVVVTGNTVVGGAAGTGGAGGVSAPGAPVAERDGNAGGAGATGVVGEQATCAGSAGC
jgi:hypothetical protein